jgi:hypothetical protein
MSPSTVTAELRAALLGEQDTYLPPPLKNGYLRPEPRIWEDGLQRVPALQDVVVAAHAMGIGRRPCSKVGVVGNWLLIVFYSFHLVDSLPPFFSVIGEKQLDSSRSPNSGGGQVCTLESGELSLSSYSTFFETRSRPLWQDNLAGWRRPIRCTLSLSSYSTFFILHIRSSYIYWLLSRATACHGAIYSI